MDLTKFNENGNAKDEVVRTRINNWRNEIYAIDNKRCDTWTTQAELFTDDIQMELEATGGKYELRSFDPIMPIKQIDICKFLKKDPEEITKEDIENYAEELWSGDACLFFDEDHEEELKAMAWKELEKEQEVRNDCVHIVFVEYGEEYYF